MKTVISGFGAARGPQGVTPQGPVMIYGSAVHGVIIDDVLATPRDVAAELRLQLALARQVPKTRAELKRAMEAVTEPPREADRYASNRSPMNCRFVHAVKRNRRPNAVVEAELVAAAWAHFRELRVRWSSVPRLHWRGGWRRGPSITTLPFETMITMEFDLR